MQQFDSDNLNQIVFYTGKINAEIIAGLLEETEYKLDKFFGILPIKRNAVSIAIELLQNVAKYLNKKISGCEINKNCRYSVYRRDNSLEISTGNYILDSDIEPLERWIKEVNSLSADQLKAFYRSSLQRSDIRNLQTISLGFADILRKSKNPVELRLEKDSTGYSYLILIARVEIEPCPK